MLDKEVCRVQFTPEGPPKFVLTKPTATRRKDYNVISYNYGSSSQDARQPLVFLPEIGGLTRCGRCFTLNELKKIKGKEVVDMSEEINKSVTKKSNQ